MGRYKLKANTLTEDETENASANQAIHKRNDSNHGVEVIQKPLTEEIIPSVEEDRGDLTDSAKFHTRDRTHDRESHLDRKEGLHSPIF